MTTRYIVTFIGDAKNPRHNPDTIVVRGVEFKLGEPTPLEVATAEGAIMIGKLKGNSHFKVVDGDLPAPKAEEPIIEKPKGKPAKSDAA